MLNQEFFQDKSKTIEGLIEDYLKTILRLWVKGTPPKMVLVVVTLMCLWINMLVNKHNGQGLVCKYICKFSGPLGPTYTKRGTSQQ